MEAAGMQLHCDLAERAIMGFTEVVRSFGFLRDLFRRTVNHLRKHRPDCVVLIDYPGFNLRLAKEARKLGIPVVYYISPQIWAWKKGRIHTLRALVNKMLVILPFEKPLYDAVGLDCVYVGHPLLDHIDSAPVGGVFGEGLIIGVLPGSREQEILRIMPAMVETARRIRDRFPEARFVAPCVDAAREAQIKAAAGDFPVETRAGGTYELLSAARFCMVASGTATLETALFEVPMVVLYRVTPITYWLARAFVRIDAIALVNILAGKRIVPEFIQGRANPNLIAPVAIELIEDSPARKDMISELSRIRSLLGSGGASEAAAREVLKVANG